MSFAAQAPAGRKNAWFGAGLSVDSQGVVPGVSTMLAIMAPFDGSARACVVQLNDVQFGVGLGGGADATLLVATGIGTSADFWSVEVEGGMDFSLRYFVSATSTPKSFLTIGKLLRETPWHSVLRVIETKPKFWMDIKDMGEAVLDSGELAVDALTSQRKLWTFPVAGVGVELSLTYKCARHLQVISR